MPKVTWTVPTSLILDAAGRLASRDSSLARETVLEAFQAGPMRRAPGRPSPGHCGANNSGLERRFTGGRADPRPLSNGVARNRARQLQERGGQLAPGLRRRPDLPGMLEPAGFS